MHRLANAAPFWMSLGLVPLAWAGAVFGGWLVLLVPLCTWYLFSVLDALIGHERGNADPLTPDSALRWHRAITLVWPVVQAFVIFGLIAYTARAPHLGGWERLGLAFGAGVISGTIGITYAHELMHQRNRIERWLGDLLMGMVLYSHFRSEHLLVHHRYVGTPRDPVTARYNEGFHRFFPRVVIACWRSAFAAEAALLARRGLPAHHPRNPFWRYLALQLGFMALAIVLGGWTGLGFFVFQALVAIWQLELVNYVEHYGLTRKHLGGGRYEHVLPRHSWNATHKASNWLLINLQRHSDHHSRPDRRFPLLQAHGPETAPQLPFGYPVMTTLAMIPPLWRRRMNPRVRAWRAAHYPEVEDWRPYNTGANPAPR
ncbi:alkane 1-monooxygenase [Profundibacterium mesophilum]|uniref:Alkane 1-monooxygenase n=1 Tax=Profundibacterium mesophilum KAUST100406-0324 TaxID=1037889 RepID=A0A921NP00_9RHOB|nr:alkane 1-monooxygenase [Profundibacterium mesophilum]KAF0675486.1 alkane 1-monooxygenase [Profundibacterium mesophilum KAUST100406-0324]